MTIVVNPHNEQEEKVLIAFLNSLSYEYQTDDIGLTVERQKEILRREQSFAEGKTTARDWEDIKKELESVYR